MVSALATIFVITIALAGEAAAAPDKPKLTASQTEDLASGTEITVTGKGFTPKTTLFVALCDTKQPPGKACDTANFARVTTDADGGLETTMTPGAVFGPTDCTVTTCALMTNDPANPRDTANFTQLPLTFAAAAPSPAASSVAPAETPAVVPSSTTPAASPVASDEDGGTSVPLIVVIAVVLLAVIVTTIFLMRRRGTKH
ncbi:neocarzinostatin apoprotein domain-containing protein [Streptosporangium sp. CA-115845]|uniref:neocarzinostatin apoprotein domain-containing protein n=1 Tax=Streptosporangium sp. CA-115845 TaxID=3240071 RepID=UPI003D93007D